ncbi:hypothetical protein CC80DRAFT_113798 [Byssothecium circinans]|uniref:Uncharacterized protein n=1 Tax=Byssothecium circinans TaxID=147558 RepID=A0A6A5TP69_9PLEO|nr:hypothetical protein CC80DRAFT_113798 [Byssothecium circinans]
MIAVNSMGQHLLSNLSLHPILLLTFLHSHSDSGLIDGSSTTFLLKTLDHSYQYRYLEKLTPTKKNLHQKHNQR